MTQRAPRRKSSLVALTSLALLALSAVAPSAFAQVDATAVPKVSNPVEAVTTTTDAVDTTTGTVTDTTTGATDTVKDTTDTTTGATDETAKGAGKVVDQTGTAVKDTSNQTKKTIDNTTSGTGSVVNDTVNDADDRGGSVVNPLLNATGPLGLDANGDGKVSKTERNLNTGARRDNKAAYGADSAADRSARRSADRGKRDPRPAAKKRSRNTSALVAAPQRESFIDQVAQAAGEAARKLAFPLGLALMVGAFLMVQGRIDRKDAKLVLAPIDSEQDLLSFQ